MKHGFAVFLIAVLSAVSAMGCAPRTPVPQTPQEPQEEYTVKNGIEDPKFERGFSLLGLDSSTDAGVHKVIDYRGEASGAPVWTAAQWWSKTDLAEGEETQTSSEYRLADASKTLAVNRTLGAVTLGVDGSKEFDAPNYMPPAKWPHLLISQSISGMPLKGVEKLQARLDFTLTKSDNLRGGTVGCQAQFAWFIYVSDTNPDSPGRGNFLWFGLNIYDSTTVYAAGTSMQDTAGGPGNFIYTVGAQETLSDRIRVGKNIKCDYDIVPAIKQALAKAQENGFMIGTTFDDCSITGTNIGWEVFDRWDVSVTIFDIGIDAYYPKED